MSHQPKVKEVLRYVKYADFPADRDRLINIAVNHDATDDVLAVLDIIPERGYNDLKDLENEIERSL